MSIARSDIATMDDYLRAYGPLLGKKAIDALEPLHIPDRDDPIDFDDIAEFNPDRVPFPAQAHAITATVRMFEEAGNGFLVGEMGTGKTIMGMLAVHKAHKGQPYRAVVLCPDHLIAVWDEEITSTIPDAKIVRFENWKGVVPLIDAGYRKIKQVHGDARSAPPRKYPVSIGGGPRFEGGVFIDEPYLFEDVEETLKETVTDTKGRERSVVTKAVARWSKPLGPEWILLGRNQAKFKPEFYGAGEEQPGFNGPREKGLCVKSVAIGKQDKTDDDGKTVYDRKTGEPIRVSVIEKYVTCPRCSAIVRGAKGIPVSPETVAKKQHTCEGVYLEGVPREGAHAEHGKDRLPGTDEHKPKLGPGRSASRPISVHGRKYVVKACNEPLWSYNRTPYRFPPSIIIQRKLRGYFSHLLIDEAHEHKSGESAQSMAAGKLMSVARHSLALTGTIIGGYADHMLALLVRMSPKTISAEGFEWGHTMPWAQRYGRVDRVVTTKEGDGEVSVSRKQTSMRKARKGESKETRYVRPGVMPTMYGRHMLGNSIFIMLNEMESELPDMFEYVGGPQGIAPKLADFIDDATGTAAEKLEAAEDHRRRDEEGWHDTACDMDEELRTEYKRVEQRLVAANVDLLKKGSAKLLGTMLWTLLDYPDKPFGWGHDPDLLRQAEKDDGTPALLGQSFLGNFKQEFDERGRILTLTRDSEAGTPESTMVPLRKEGGVYWLDTVVVNGKKPVSMVYDTGASSISISSGMAASLGIKAKPGDRVAGYQIADGSIVQGRKTAIDSVQVGKFTVKNVECGVMPPKGLGHTVGYYDAKNDYTPQNWRGVVTPAELDSETIRPKERRLIDICVQQKKEGKQSWVYVNMTGKRNVQPRLRRLLEEAGLKVCVLASGDCKPIDRKEWIDKNGPDYDVIISNPSLVSTGLTLFSKKSGGHNYSTLIFYETGYNLFTLRQAARRAWRIGQPHDCRVYYLYYRETMQQRAMALMSKKMAAAAALEGEFSSEGLVGMDDEGGAQMALAKSLKDKIKDEDTQRNWSRSSGVRKRPKAKASPTTGAWKPLAVESEPDFDDMTDEKWLAAKTIIDAQAVSADDFEDFDDDDDDEWEYVPLTPEQIAELMTNLDAA